MLNQGPGGHDLKCNHQGKQCPCLQVSMVDGSLSLAGIWFQVTNLTPVIKISGIFFFFFFGGRPLPNTNGHPNYQVNLG